MSRRILALLLTLCMLFSIAAAEGTVPGADSSAAAETVTGTEGGDGKTAPSDENDSAADAQDEGKADEESDGKTPEEAATGNGTAFVSGSPAVFGIVLISDNKDQGTYTHTFAGLNDTVTLDDLLSENGITLNTNYNSITADDSLITLECRSDNIQNNNCKNYNITAAAWFDDTVLTLKPANPKKGKTYILHLKNPKEEEPELIDGTLRYNDDLYLTGQLPENGIVEMEPAEVEIDGVPAAVAYDINIYTSERQKEKGETWQPAGEKMQVHFRDQALEGARYANVYHLADREAEPELVAEEVDVKDGGVTFEAESFSIYAVATLEDNILRVIVQDLPEEEIVLDVQEEQAKKLQDAMLLSGSQNADGTKTTKVQTTAATTLTMEGTMPRKANVEAEHAEGYDDALLAYDITILDTDGSAYQPAEGETIEVSIQNTVISYVLEAGRELEVYHIESDGSRTFVESRAEGDTITFDAASFSVYVIVEAPEPVAYGGDIAVTVTDLTSERGLGGFYLSVTQGEANNYYFTATVNGNGALVENTDLTAAAVWYFEKAGEASNEFYIYTLVNNEKKYIQQKTANSAEIKLSAAGTVFAVTVAATGTFYIKHAGENRWLQHSGSGSGIRFYTQNSNAGNSRIMMSFVREIDHEADPYGFDGKTYGIMNYNGNTSAYAMLAETANGNTGLKRQYMLIRYDPMDPDRKLYVARDTSMPMWEIHHVRDDIYTLSWNGHYLRIGDTAVTLTDTADDYCSLRIVPGTGSRAGKIRIVGAAANKALQMGDDNNGFTPATFNNNNNQWHNFADLSVYDESDFIEYTAYKVGASDTLNVDNGHQVILYVRLWNENKYDFYAIDHNGKLIPCFESGDTIVWIGAQINTTLWNFTEYYRPGTNVSNDTYDIQNSYTGLYLAPDLDNADNIFSDTPFGVNLTGRSYGDYYTPIVSWDDAHYDYAGLKAENGKLAACPESEAITFYFAVMKRTEHELRPVATVDHSELGLTMKMVDCPDRAFQNGVLGSTEDHGNEARTTPGLLSKHIEENAQYPITVGGSSLGNLYEGAMTVNHLFIQSIYDGSGYYQFDSSQNFAQLNKTEKVFTVYQELGAVAGTGTTRKHGQFMPYNTLRTDQAHPTNPSNLYDIYGNALPESDPRKYETLYGFNEPENHNFAMEIEGHFLMPPSGHDAWGNDIIFDFVGDDDFWLYVDGELVLDLGGIHKAVGGTVNYSTGTVNVNGTPTTLYDLFRENYKERNGVGDDDPGLLAFLDGYFQDKTVNGTTHKVFKDYSTHTVRIFYMERGEGASNLRMRFNLAAITQGQVLLSKEVTGTDKNDYAGAKFAFQVMFRSDADDAEFEPLSQEQLTDTGRWQVVYRNTSNPVEYAESAEIGGNTYENVFYLKPGQTAAIKLPDNTLHYYIRECGVDPAIYDQVFANADELTGTENGSRKDYQTTEASVTGRASIMFRNKVNPNALRTLTVKVRLFDENDEEMTPVSPGFGLRLYLGEQLDYYKNSEYFVKNTDGYYCYYDYDAQAFAPIGEIHYSDLTAADLERVTFSTSFSGAVSKIPAGYSVEIRDLLVDTKFKVTAEDYDNPVGYGKRTWTETDGATTKTYTGYKRMEGSFITDGEENSGVIRDNSQAAIEVHFRYGWGIRAEKEWTDKDFMFSHDYVFFAVYAGESLLPETVRRIDAYNYTTYFFPALESGIAFTEYSVREVELTDPVAAADGTVASYSTITPKIGGDQITLGGQDIDQQRVDNLSYTVSYTPGSSADGRTRTDVVTNTRAGGLKVQVQAQENPLPGAVFVLKKGEETIGTFTSDAAGLVTDAYPEDGTYTLTQTKAPQGYRGMQEPISITVSGGSFVFSGDDSVYEYDADTGTLTIRNTPFTLRAVKADSSDSTVTLPGARFALYRQVTGADGTLRKDYYPLSGYEDLESGEQGVIPGISESLAPGGYYLVETQTIDDYIPAEEPVLFHISETGALSAEQGSGYIGWIPNPETSVNGVLQYTLFVPNTKEAMKTLTVTKTVGGAMGDMTLEFTFTLSGLAEGTAVSWTKQAKASADGAYADLAEGGSGEETADSSGQISFTLKHWQKIALTVPAGTELTLTEEHGYYTQTITGLTENTTTGIADVTGGKKFTLAGDDTVNFRNELAAVSPTGVTFTVTPWLLTLLAGGILLLLAAQKKKKKA